MTSPIALFAFNRPDALRRCLEALSVNELARDTDLFIWIDGPRGDADREKVAAVQEVAHGARGFRSLEVSCSEKNRGLAPSIIAGVGSLLDRYESVIVLEDDLMTHPGFLRFLNDGLERYRDVPEVFSVCGYTNDVRMPRGYSYDAYFGPRSSSWGWATWRDRWQSVDWNPTSADLQKNARAFNRWGGSDCSGMLHKWMEGKNSSWAIRFCYSEFLQGKLSVFPVESLVDATLGFSGEGTHCKSYNRFRSHLAPAAKRDFTLPGTVEVIPSVRRDVLRYNSVPLRAWTRLMNLFYA
jgi:hypothetical protein